MREPVDHGIRPISQAVRDAQRALSDAIWNGDAEAATRAHAVLASLKSQQERGEQYAVPF